MSSRGRVCFFYAVVSTTFSCSLAGTARASNAVSDPITEGAATVQEVHAFAYSPDSSRLALVAGDPGRTTLNIEVRDARTLKSIVLPVQFTHKPNPERHSGSLGESVSTELSWSPSGNRLAFITAGDDGEARLHVWSAATGRVVAADRVPSPGSFRWSPDGRFVYLLSGGERGPRSSYAPADPPATGSPIIRDSRSEQEREAYIKEVKPADLYRFDPIAREVIPLACRFGGQEIVAVLKAGTVLVEGAAPLNYRPGSPHQAYKNLFAIAGAGRAKPCSVGDAKSQPTALLPSTKTFFSVWSVSPDEKTIAYVEQGELSDGDIILANLKTGHSRNLTATAPPIVDPPLPRAMSRDFAYPGSRFGSVSYLSIFKWSPIWSPDGRRLLLSRYSYVEGEMRRELWSVDTTSGTGARVLSRKGCDVLNGAAAGARLVVTSYCAMDGRTLVEAVDLRSGKVSAFASMSGDRPALVQVTPAGAVALATESPHKAEEVYWFDPKGGTPSVHRPLNTAVAPQNIVSRIVTWPSAKGDPLHGMVTYLGSIDPAKAPLIVEVYPYPMHAVRKPYHRFLRLERDFGPLKQLLQDGAVLFQPYVPVSGHGYTCVDVASDVDAGVMAIGAQGLANSDQIGVFGYSFGGGTVGCLVTRSKTIKAAVAGAGAYYNPISERFAPGAMIMRFAFDEGGQLDIGKTLFEAPDLWLRESTILRLKDVTAPLLLMHGTADGVPYQNSEQMYAGLSDLEKVVKLAIFPGATHASLPERPEFVQLMRDWFHEHLKFNGEARLEDCKSGTASLAAPCSTPD